MVQLPFVTPDSGHDQAAAILTTVWGVQNTIEKQQWQDQLDRDAMEADKRRQEREEIEKVRQDKLDKEKEEQLKEERKKNRSKFIPIPPRGIPTTMLIIISTIATRCRDKGDYVPLWYFTNARLDNTAKAFSILEEDVLSLVKRDDGSTSLVSALSSKESRSVVEDNKLSWDDFCIAAPHMISAISWSEWPPDQINMMTKFWMNINTHPYRLLRDPLDQNTLLLYQAEQRKLWHQAINSPGHRYDLLQINEELLHQTKDRLYWIKWGQRDDAMAKDCFTSVSTYTWNKFTDLFSLSTSFTIKLTPPPSLNACHACCLGCWLFSLGLHCFCACCLMVYDGTSSMFSICTSIIPPIVYLSCTSSSWEFSHQVILSFSMTNHVAIFHPHLSSTTKIHIGILDLPNEGGLGPASGQIIISDASMTTRTRIFYMAQTRMPIPFVPSVWACTYTTSSHVMHPEHGMDGHHATMAKRSKGDLHLRGNDTPICMDWQRAQAPSTTPNTSVQVVVLPLMELRAVLEHRRLMAHTPYHPDVWEYALWEVGLTQKYPDIVTGLHHGFNISFPPIITTQSPPNKESVIDFVDEFDKIIHNKIQKGQYIRPISGKDVKILIGPFQFSPFSIIPKLGWVGKYCNIQNYSFPTTPFINYLNPSINSWVDLDSFPTTWGTFSVVSLLIHWLPPGSQLATRDVKEAYCTIPLHYSQWPSTVVHLDNDTFTIDTALCFGSGPSAGMYGIIRDMATDILHSQGIGLISSWVDDHSFIRIWCNFLPEYNHKHRAWNSDIMLRGRQQEGGRIWFGGQILKDGTLEEFNEDYTFLCKDLSELSAWSADDTLYIYNFDDIDRVSCKLGIPWEISNDRPFASSTTYIGYNWDIETYQVSLATTKREKYLEVMQLWLKQLMHTLKDVKKLHGKLLHTCLVLPMGWAYLTELERMLVILSYHTPAWENFKQTWSGGSGSFNSTPSPEIFLSLFPSTMPKLFWTPAWNSALLSPLVISGEPGISSQDGRHWMGSETLTGQKPSLLNAWSVILPIMRSGSDTSSYMGITGESLKVGGMEGAATERSMRSSRDFMNFPIEARVSPPSTQLTLGANFILQMCPQEKYTLQNAFSFSWYNSYQSSTISLSMPCHPSQWLNCDHTETFFLPQ